MKKRILSLILAAVSLLALFPAGLLSTTAEASTWTMRTEYPSSSSDAWKYYSAPLNTFELSPYNNGNCTWYAYGRAYEVFGKDCGLRGAGNAGNWYSYAQSNGMSVGTVPKAGSIICWSTHVGFVESVEGSTVTWTESNYQFSSSSSVRNFKNYSSTHPETYCSAFGGTLLGYIYLDSTHTHNYSEYMYYWKSHPHYKCYKCSCGDIKENRAETVYIESCEQCNPPAVPETAKITTQPKNVTVNSGKTAQVTIKASGDGLIYTWYYAKKGAKSYTKASGTTNAFAVTASASFNGCKVYCVVKDQYGNSVKSKVVTLTVRNVAQITTQPESVLVSKNKTAKVTVKASGDGLKYQWYYANKGATKWKKSSVTKATYSTKMTASKNGRRVYCVITDKYGNSVKSSVVTLAMKQTAKITTQPKKTAVYAGSTAKFSVKASGDGLSYTWYYAKKGAKKYTKAADTDSVFEVKASSSLNGCKVYCVVKDKYGNSAKSKVVTLTVKNKAKVTTQPESVSVANGKTAKVTVKATGDGLKYQWYYAKKGSSDYKKISGATKSGYSVKMTSSVNGRKVYCKVTDKYGNSVKTNVVTLSVASDFKELAGEWISTDYITADGELISYGYGYCMDISADGTVCLQLPEVGAEYSYKLESAGKATYQHYYRMRGKDSIFLTYYLTTDTIEFTFAEGDGVYFERY